MLGPPRAVALVQVVVLVLAAVGSASIAEQMAQQLAPRSARQVEISTNRS